MNKAEAKAFLRTQYPEESNIVRAARKAQRELTGHAMSEGCYGGYERKLAIAASLILSEKERK